MFINFTMASKSKHLTTSASFEIVRIAKTIGTGGINPFDQEARRGFVALRQLLG